jgi:hypothetical protein
MGTWRANLAKSHRDPNHQFQSLELVFAMKEGTVQMTFSGSNMAGEPESGKAEFHPDGKEHAVEGAPGVVQITAWESPNVLYSRGLKDGKVVGEVRYEVSDDGATMTERIRGIDAQGAEFEHVLVFDRE